MSIINIYQAKTQFSQLVARVLLGEEVVIGRAGRPVAKLVPYTRVKPDRIPGALKGQIEINEGFDDSDDEIAEMMYGSG